MREQRRARRLRTRRPAGRRPGRGAERGCTPARRCGRGPRARRACGSRGGWMLLGLVVWQRAQLMTVRSSAATGLSAADAASAVVATGAFAIGRLGVVGRGEASAGVQWRARRAPSGPGRAGRRRWRSRAGSPPRPALAPRAEVVVLGEREEVADELRRRRQPRFAIGARLTSGRILAGGHSAQDDPHPARPRSVELGQVDALPGAQPQTGRARPARPRGCP